MDRDRLLPGYGPYTLKEWIHDTSITMIKNPFWPGIENLGVSKLDEVSFRCWTMFQPSPSMKPGTWMWDLYAG